MLAHLLAQPFQPLEQHGHGAVRHHQGKLLAAKAGDHGIGEELGEQTGEVTQQLIADGVTPVIVDLLEVIHIEHAQCKRCFLALVLLEPFLTLVEPVAPVVEPGQVVAIGRLLDAVELLQRLQIVADPALQLFRLERLVEEVVGTLFEVAGGEAAFVRHRDPYDGELLLAVALAQHAYQADPVNFWHIVVDQYQPDGRVLLELGQRFTGVARLVHLQQLLAQLGHGAVAGGTGIIDHQHFDALVEVEAMDQADGILQGVT